MAALRIALILLVCHTVTAMDGDLSADAEVNTVEQGPRLEQITRVEYSWSEGGQSDFYDDLQTTTASNPQEVRKKDNNHMPCFEFSRALF